MHKWNLCYRGRNSREVSCTRTNQRNILNVRLAGLGMIPTEKTNSISSDITLTDSEKQVTHPIAACFKEIICIADPPPCGSRFVVYSSF